MDKNKIQSWLGKKKIGMMVGKCVGAMLSCCGGVIVLFLTFWLAYFVAWLASSGFLALVELFFGSNIKIGNSWFLIASSVFMALLFVQYFRTDAMSWGRYARQESEMDARLRSDIHELVPEAEILQHSGLMAKLFSDIFLIGPRLLIGTFIRLKEIRRIRCIEIDMCAEILALICVRNDTVSYEELSKLGWGAKLVQLKLMDGVSFLKHGLFLSDELRTELNNLE